MTEIQDKDPTDPKVHDVHELDRLRKIAADVELVKAICQKRADRLATFIDRLACIPRILSARNRAMGRPLSQADLDDVAQDSLTVVWRKLDTFQGTSLLETWVYRIADNELKNRVRRQSFREGRRAPMAELELISLPGGEALGEDYADVHRALGALEPEHLAVVHAKHFEGLSFQELAIRLDVPPGTAKFRYYQAVDRLRVLLKHRKEEFE